MHTKEPWRVASFGNGRFSVAETQENGRHSYFCDITTAPSFSNEEKEANARRIVACVNACAGISTEELEQKGLPIYMHESITKQRDELLAAAKQIRPFIEDGDVPQCYWSEPFRKALYELDEAIAKADLTQ